MKPDYHEQVETIYIEDIIKETVRAWWCRTADGRLIWLSKRFTQLMPGRAIVPLWLFQKIMKSPSASPPPLTTDKAVQCPMDEIQRGVDWARDMYLWQAG